MSRRRAPASVAATIQPLPATQSPYRATISGGCTVTNLKTAREAAWAALTFHAIHRLPVLIGCDIAAYDDLSEIRSDWPEDIVLQVVPFEVPSRVRSHNGYHNAAAIAAKMITMKLAIAGFGDAAFFDADMTFLSALPAPEDAQLMLSHNFENFVTRGQHGLYNAGLVWSANTAFCDWWSEEYLSGRSSFYEQSALDGAPARWRSSFFGAEHNWGHWRGPIGLRSVSSIHCHLSTALDGDMTDWSRDRIFPLRAEALAHIAAHPILSCLSSPI